MKDNYQELSASSNSNLRQFSPKKQEWALINQYKALEFQRLKQKQRQIANQKKLKFRRQLDNQLNSKNNVNSMEKQADRNYYQYITQKAEQQRLRQQREKNQRILKRKKIQEENIHKLQITLNSRMKDYDTGYHLDIGHKSELERKRNSQNIKKQVLDTLDHQLKKKQEQKYKSRIQNYQADLKNLQYQYHQFDDRKMSNKIYGQNQKIYQYYKQLQKHKKQRQLQLQHKLVDEAALKKKQEEDQRSRRQYLQKTTAQQHVKQTLDQQVRFLQKKKWDQMQTNPQQYSYGVIGNVFRQKHASYDKNKYYEQLRRQADQQKRKKQQMDFMTEEQYRLNMNQLNKVVNGQYLHETYIDRSMGTIGDNKKLRLADISDSINDMDAEAVKNRLQNLRQRNKSHVISKTDRSF